MSDERAAVKTYVPAYQRDVWRDHADELGMSLSEFVRTMVQSGRRGFVGDDPADAPAADAAADENASGEDPGSSGSNPGGGDLEPLILDAVPEDGAASWDELLAAATDDVEARLDATLERLQDAGELRYSGRAGGYVRVEP